MRFDDLVLRLPNAEDLEGLAAAFTAGELSETDNISPFTRDELATELQVSLEPASWRGSSWPMFTAA